MDIIKIRETDISDRFLDGFHHIQEWTKQYRRKDNTLELFDVFKTRVWSDEKRLWIASYLKDTVENGGIVLGAFEGEVLVGFAAIDGAVRGNVGRYINLSMLFVDDHHKRRGIGKALLNHSISEAKKLGGEKLFISSIPSFETVSFYLSMGAVFASEIVENLVDTEEDIYLEIKL